MLQQDGLAASAGADDRGDAAARTIKINAIENLLAAKAPAQLAHADSGAISRGSLSFIEATILQKNRRKEIVPKQDKHARKHDRFGGRAANAGRHPLRVVALVTADPHHDEPKNQRLI